jgi:CRP-like cAMP-binding protein
MYKRELLKNNSIFSGIPSNVLDIVSAEMEKVEIDEGGLIFEEGAVADSFYIVEKGEVVISKNLKAGRRKILAVIKDGALFGEMAFFSDSPRIASARARAASTLWRLPRDKFADIVSKHPSEGLKIFSGLLEVAMDRLEQTSRELATIYETGRVIASGKSLGEISSAVAEELLVSIPDAAKSAVYIYNEFNEEFESPGLPEIPASSPFAAKITSAPAGLSGACDSAGLSLPDFSGAFAAVGIFKPKSETAQTSMPSGFILLWTHDAGVTFTNANLLLLSSVAGQLAAALENLRHREEELNRRRLKQEY